MEPENLSRAEELLGYTFKDRTLLLTALTHASIADTRVVSNERLEFLGDAVLGLITCEHLYRRFTDLLEGELTKIKSSAVSRRTCADLATELGLDEVLFLGKGMSNRATLPGSVLAAVFESLIGAIYLDGGIDEARRFILDGLEHRITLAARSGHQYNFKSVLQQSAQQILSQMPQYVVLDEQGPDHAKCFEVCVEIGTRRFRSCWGTSKKEAEQQAALEALFALGVAERRDNGEVRMRPVDPALNGHPPTPPTAGTATPDAARTVPDPDDPDDDDRLGEAGIVAFDDGLDD
ncbi:MAG: ribonuclease III [Phycisphaerales bacterium]|nr:ribonuclease III [Phycisphaerales bacterium]